MTYYKTTYTFTDEFGGLILDTEEIEVARNWILRIIGEYSVTLTHSTDDGIVTGNTYTSDNYEPLELLRTIKNQDIPGTTRVHH